METVLTLLAQEYGATVQDLVDRGVPIEKILVQQPDSKLVPAKPTEETPTPKPT